MYSPYPDGSEIKIGFDDEEITVYLPKPGWVTDFFTGELEYVGFINAHQKPKEMKVTKGRRSIKLPEDWKEWVREEKKMQAIDPDAFHPEAEAHRIQEWSRRLSGCWMKIYNPKTKKAEPVYLTGLHYFYCFYWKCDFGLPDLRFVDLEVFYLLQYTEEDPTSNGLTLATLRRFGKTAILGCWLFEHTSRTPNSYGGLQSKTREDASKVFNLSVVYPWKNLPEYFRPKYDFSSTQKSELAFVIPPPRGKQSREEYDVMEDDSLHSYINFRDSGVYAYDGYKLHRLAVEEPGKTTEVDVYKRHMVVKPCTEVGGDVIGQIFAPTTVEELEGVGADAYKLLFRNSRYSEKLASPSGKTATGLYCHFIPAFKGYRFDEYGHSMIDESKAELLAVRESLADKPQELAGFIRKYPFTIEEAFMAGEGTCVFNEYVLNQRLQELNALPTNKLPYTQGDLEWSGEIDGEVEFHMNPLNGKFLFSWIPEPEHLNKVKKDSYGEWVPMMDLRHAVATDPISHTKTVDPRSSRAAAHGFRKYDPSSDLGKPESEWESHNFIFEYLHRPDELEEYFEDMIKVCRFLGCQLLYESQKNNIGQHFRARGYRHFLMYRPETTWTNQSGNQDTEGAPASKEMIDTYIAKLKTFVNRHGHRIPFPRTIEDLIRFNPLKTKEFDAAVSAGWTMVALEKQYQVIAEPFTSKEWFDEFDIAGERSVLIGA